MLHPLPGRDVNSFSFFLKTIVSYENDDEKIENGTIVYKNDRFLKSSFFKNDRTL